MRRFTMLAALGLTGCETLTSLLEALSQLDLLGAIPAEGFSNRQSPDAGKLTLALAGRNDVGKLIGPVTDDLEVVSDDGTLVSEPETTEVEGHDIGSFIVLVDGSASVEADPTCPGCPTDPDRIRVDAAKQMAQAVAECSGDWRLALFEFGADAPSRDFSVDRVLASWTTEAQPLVNAANELGSYYGTPLWDGVLEAVLALGDDADREFVEKDDAGRAIVVISDGADNESINGLGAVIDAAIDRGVTVHAIGFGPASDLFRETDRTAVNGLQRLAEGTGGTYGYVDDIRDLPPLAASIGGAICTGYTEIVTTFEEPPESGALVTGRVRSKSNQALAVPFSFRAP